MGECADERACTPTTGSCMISVSSCVICSSSEPSTTCRTSQNGIGTLWFLNAPGRLCQNAQAQHKKAPVKAVEQREWADSRPCVPQSRLLLHTPAAPQMLRKKKQINHTKHTKTHQDE
eukprot:4853165-Pleurochrysis_carterae.AAC.11